MCDREADYTSSEFNPVINSDIRPTNYFSVSEHNGNVCCTLAKAFETSLNAKYHCHSH